MSTAKTIELDSDAGLSLKASILGFLGSTTVMTILMVIAGNMH